jgi:hypothetical protein
MDNIRETMHQFCKRAMETFKEESIPTLTGERADNYLSLLSGYSAMIYEEIGEIELRKAEDFLLIRAKCKSNADAERLWNATEDGKRYIVLDHRLKAVKEVTRACRDRLKRLNNESFNRY